MLILYESSLTFEYDQTFSFKVIEINKLNYETKCFKNHKLLLKLPAFPLTLMLTDVYTHFYSFKAFQRPDNTP